MSEKFLQYMRALILKGYVAGLIPRELARKKCNAITKEIERIVKHESSSNGRG
jgi:hypothetical protein